MILFAEGKGKITPVNGSPGDDEQKKGNEEVHQAVSFFSCIFNMI
jgi:hypothetical protein